MFPLRQFHCMNYRANNDTALPDKTLPNKTWPTGGREKVAVNGGRMVSLFTNLQFNRSTLVRPVLQHNAATEPYR